MGSQLYLLESGFSLNHREDYGESIVSVVVRL